MTREVEVTIKPDGSSLAVCIYNSGMLEMGARVRRESDDVTEEILYQVATIHEDMVSQRDELGRELLQLKQERDQLTAQNSRLKSFVCKVAIPALNLAASDYPESVTAQMYVTDADSLLKERLSVSIVEIKAQAIEEFAREIGVYDPEYGDQGYVEVPRYAIKEYIDRIRKEAQCNN